MASSGSGKSTLLNVLAHRAQGLHASVKAAIYINGAAANPRTFRKISAYVEQEDALVGSLTVRETLNFAARLSLPSTVSKLERIQRIEALITAFGLQGQANTLIGTPIRKGISGGQKRRVSVAAQLITSPKLLFLDEPTSGLDSAASFEVISFVKDIAKKHNVSTNIRCLPKSSADSPPVDRHFVYPSAVHFHIRHVRQAPPPFAGRHRIQRSSLGSPAIL